MARFADWANAVVDAFAMVFQETAYALTALVAALLMGVTYPLLFPIAAGARRVSILAFRGGLGDVALLTVVSALFGVIVAMQLYSFRNRSAGSSKMGFVGIAASLVSSKACCLLPLLLLTLGATTGVAFFVRHATAVRLVSLSLLTLSLYLTAKGIAGRGDCCKASPGRG